MGNDLNAWISNSGIVDAGFDLPLNPWKNEKAEKSECVCMPTFCRRRKIHYMPCQAFDMKWKLNIFSSWFSSIIPTGMELGMNLKDLWYCYYYYSIILSLWDYCDCAEITAMTWVCVLFLFYYSSVLKNNTETRTQVRSWSVNFLLM